MEYALQKLPVLANNLSLSIRSPVLVYSFLALYGLLMVLLLAYVQTKFRIAARTLKQLQADWQSAESKHSNFVGMAQERLATLSRPAPQSMARAAVVGTDMRTQVVAMAKRGLTVNDIARTCSLQEGEIDVILGMARLQR